MLFIKKQLLILFLLLLPAALSAGTKFNDSLYAKRLNNLPQLAGTNIVFNAKASDYITEFIRSPYTAAEALGRYEFYKPYIDSVLDAYQVPRVLGLMMLGNSMANCAYHDEQGNSGPWAMQYNVGRMWDLKMNTYVDERRDFEKSTDAAVRYISELKTIYNRYQLAIAAFATSTTTINKVIRLSDNVFDYWKIYDSLPAAAQKAVPQFLAAVYLYNFHSEHGIEPKAYNTPTFDTVQVKQWQSFDDMAVALHTSAKILKELNPEFKQGIVPQSRAGYVVRLPISSKAWYKEIDSMSFEPYNMNPYIEKVPELPNKNIPIAKKDEAPANGEGKTPQANTDKKTEGDTITHIVQRGEGLGIIAQKYGVKVDDVKQWNDLKGYTIYPNQKLIIIPAKK
jgi:membrane-bound lytic murein transglycosylase D